MTYRQAISRNHPALTPESELHACGYLRLWHRKPQDGRRRKGRGDGPGPKPEC